MGVLFCSDLHFGHKNIGKFRKVPDLNGVPVENEERIIADWNKKVTKRDVVYVLGDAAFTTKSIEIFSALAGRKILIRGNHDKLDTHTYLKYFDGVYGLLKYKEFWLSHPPIHPDELRGKVNLHGHVHYATIHHPWEEYYNEKPKPDERYFNCCPENLWEKYGSALVTLEEIRKELTDNTLL